MFQTVKNPSTMQETRVRSLGWEDPLEKEMTIHSSPTAWKIPWTDEPGRLQSLGWKESDTNERQYLIFDLRGSGSGETLVEGYNFQL